MSVPAGMEAQWSFAASQPSLLVHALRAKAALRGWSAFPAWQAIAQVEPAARWNGYFAYCPDDRAGAHHLDTLDRLAALPGRLACVVASSSPSSIPDAIARRADALYWKARPGFDFSAYAILLDAIADRSAGADFYMQNDSVLGPLTDPEPILAALPWRLNGFLASSAVENHIQSYAFFVRALDRELADALGGVMSLKRSLDAWDTVVLRQETRFAREASRHVSTGSWLYDPRPGQAEESLVEAIGTRLSASPAPRATLDPSLIHALELLDAGFPFAKRSLLSRNSSLVDSDALRAALTARSVPAAVVDGS